jgi:hypothetical protein
MQRGYNLLIAGCGILALGIILIGITFVILKQQSFNAAVEKYHEKYGVACEWIMK